MLVGAGATLVLSVPYYLARPGDLREFVRLNFTPFTPTMHKGSFSLHNLLRDLLFRIDVPALHRRTRVGTAALNVLGAVILLAAASDRPPGAAWRPSGCTTTRTAPPSTSVSGRPPSSSCSRASGNITS